MIKSKNCPGCNIVPCETYSTGDNDICTNCFGNSSMIFNVNFAGEGKIVEMSYRVLKEEAVRKTFSELLRLRRENTELERDTKAQKDKLSKIERKYARLERAAWEFLGLEGEDE